MNYTDITFKNGSNFQSEAVLDDLDSRSVFERFAERLVSLVREFLSSLEELFAYSEAEWTPLKDSEFQAFLKQVRIEHLRTIVLPEDFILGNKGLADLTENDKNALLKRVNKVKRDFYQSCMDDVFGIPGNLDGNTAGNSLLAFLFDLQNFKKEHPEDPAIDRMLNTFKETYKFVVEREAVERLANKREQAFRKQEYIGKVAERLQNLKPGECFVYKLGVSNHAMLLEFKAREEAGKRVLDIKLLNSGDGLQYHHSKNFLGEFNPFAKFQTYMIEGLEQDVLLSTDFVSKLIEQEVPGEVLEKRLPVIGHLISFLASVYHDLTGIGKVYRLLKVYAINHAQGKKVISDDPRMHHFPQNRGTCSRRIYDYWMRVNLSSDVEFKSYLADSAKFGLSRLKLAETLENNLKGTAVKVDSLKDRLFVQPHWFSKGVACLRNKMNTRTMVIIGEEIEAQRRKQLEVLRSAQI